MDSISIVHLYISVDVTTYHRGFHGDLNETFFVGNVEEKAKTLVRVTHECLAKAISAGKNLVQKPYRIYRCIILIIIL